MRPWYPFYPSDYERDTKFLSPMADLVYRRLLDLYWQNQGPIPLNYTAIALAIRLDTRVVKRYLHGELSPYWVASDAHLINDRMDAEIKKSDAIHEVRAKAGKYGGLAKAKANAKANAVANDLAPQPQPHKDSKNTPSGKPDNTAKEHIAIAKKVIEYLNVTASKKFRPVDTNMKFITARLKEGHSENDLMWVIDRKVDEWLTDPSMNKYLRPATLFNAEKFNQYIGEKGVERPLSEKEAFYKRIRGEDTVGNPVIEGDFHVVK